MLLSSSDAQQLKVCGDRRRERINVVGIMGLLLRIPAAEDCPRRGMRGELGPRSFCLSDHLLAPSPVLAFGAPIASWPRPLGTYWSSYWLAGFIGLMALSFAALDYLSAGRMVMAVGTGANLADYAACGIPLEGRGKRLDEGIECSHGLVRPSRLSGVLQFEYLYIESLNPAPRFRQMTSVYGALRYVLNCAALRRQRLRH